MANSDIAKYESYLMGNFPLSDNNVHHAVDGRFLVAHKRSSLTVVDLFHANTSTVQLDFSSSAIEESSSTMNSYEVRSVYAISIDTALVLFTPRHLKDLYLGVGRMRSDRSMMVVEQATILLTYNWPLFCTWHPQSYPPKLHEGLFLKIVTYPDQGYHFMVKMKANGQLRATPLDVPTDIEVFGCFDGFVYGLVYGRSTNNDENDHPLDLVQLSLTTGEQRHTPTINWTRSNCFGLTYLYPTPGFLCCIGQTLLARTVRQHDKKCEIMALDLDTLEWRSAGISMDSIESIISDGKRTLIVRTTANKRPFNNIYRFVLNEPDKLSDLTWLRLKRIFDSRPDAYNFILSQLPKNFKQKCPFLQSGNADTTIKTTADIEESIMEYPPLKKAKGNEDSF